MGRRRAASVVCVVALLAVAAATAAGAVEPRLVTRDRSPLTLEGVGFRAGERLVVVVRAPALAMRRSLRADGRGRFRTVIQRLSLEGPLRCAAGVTVVVRACGRVVLWRPPQLPDCPSPPRLPA